MPFSTDEAAGHRHSKSCQQRWQCKNSSGLLFPSSAKEGKQFSYRAGPFGANSDPSGAPPGLAVYCTARAFCNLFRCILTLFSWHCHVEIRSFGGLAGGGGVSRTLSCSIFSAEFTRTEQLAISPLHQRTTIHAGDGIFKPSIYIRTLKHEAIQNGIFGCHLPLLRHKNQVMILFFLKQLLAWLFETSVADFKIILQNQKSTDV